MKSISIMWNLTNEQGCCFDADRWEGLSHKCTIKHIVNDMLNRSGGDYVARFLVLDDKTDRPLILDWCDCDHCHTVYTNGRRNHFIFDGDGNKKRITKKQLIDILSGFLNEDE